MSTHHNPPSGDIDARLQFLLQSTESLHATTQEHSAQIAENGAQIAENATQIAALSKTVSDLVTATAALLRISHSHKERLDKLDGGNRQ